jgi:hypothetical protein
MRNGADRRDGLVASWPKLAEGRMKNDCVVELERMRGLVLVVSTTGLLFLWSPWGCNGHPKPPEAGLVEQSGGGNTGLHNGRPVRSR